MTKEKFEAFLCEFEVFDNFFAYSMTLYDLDEIGNIDDLIWFTSLEYSDLTGCFTWVHTLEGYDFWDKLNQEWRARNADL